MRPDVQIFELIAAGGGVIVRGEHPELAGALAWLLRTRRLVAVLPGIYAHAETAGDPTIRMRAAMARHLDGVLTGSAAARMSYWPEVAVDHIGVAAPQKIRPAAGYQFSRRHVPPELVMTRSRLRLSCPALTAVDLAPTTSADSIDLALRRRAVTLDGLHRALQLTPNRRGNVDRRQILLESRHEPWSAAERLAHRVLRQNRVEGWKSNLPVWVAGRRYYIDIAFRSVRLAVEIDGRLHEDDPDLFESDRWRQNALVLAGWQVLRFTWAMLRDHPEQVVATIMAALRTRKVTAG